MSQSNSKYFSSSSSSLLRTSLAALLSQYQHPRTTITTITRPTIATHRTIHRRRVAPTMDRVITTIHHIMILIMCSQHRSTITTIRTQYSTIAFRQYHKPKTRFTHHPLEQRLVSLITIFHDILPP